VLCRRFAAAMKLPPLTVGCSLALPTPTVLVLVVLLLSVAGGCAAAPARPAPPSTTTDVPSTTTTAPSAVRVVAAGDISCEPGMATTSAECRMGATADLISALDPDVVLPLGDLQYDFGKADDFVASYATNWGRFKDRTRPVIGNHEYTGGRANGYFGWFGDAAHGPDGWYSFDPGSGWHVVVLNSVCAAVGGCGEGSRQLAWLRADLAATSAECILAAWHHPRWSSGLHGSDGTMAPVWDALAARGADLVLSGHDHHYERFAPRDGLVQFVVGTGGRNLYPVLGQEEASQVRNTATFGVLDLALQEDGYDWRFVPIPGAAGFTDEGSAGCR
jgi:acid phosphatase type 7